MFCTHAILYDKCFINFVNISESAFDVILPNIVEDSNYHYLAQTIINPENFFYGKSMMSFDKYVNAIYRSQLIEAIIYK